METRIPVILTISQLLITGLDAPTCRNVVLVRLVNSIGLMPGNALTLVEFKQIIGHGTRVRDYYGKLWFNILDYTGTVTRNFVDPDFDGAPSLQHRKKLTNTDKSKTR
jgi:type I restriction enzyme R subunit